MAEQTIKMTIIATRHLIDLIELARNGTGTRKCYSNPDQLKEAQEIIERAEECLKESQPPTKGE